MDREKVVPKERAGERRFYDKTASRVHDLFFSFFLLRYSKTSDSSRRTEGER
jgi:hypothetical protein